MNKNIKFDIEFDIALSFAGEDRNYVEQVADILEKKGISVFYDKFEEVKLWGKNLYDYLNEIYSNKALYTVMFISKNYSCKLWTNHERQAMQARAFQGNQEYILPARFDDTEILGIFDTIGYISLKEKNPHEFAEIICQKLVISGRTIPSENLRNSSSVINKLSKVSPIYSKIFICDNQDNPIDGVSVVLVADNNTCLPSHTAKNGLAELEIKIRRKYTVLVAHKNYPAVIVKDFDPDEDLQIKLEYSENIGSVIYPSGTGYIPGLKGRLNPILDSLNRNYIYADNIAVNGGQQQPVAFEINKVLNLEDCDGVTMQVMIRLIQGQISLIEFVT